MNYTQAASTPSPSIKRKRLKTRTEAKGSTPLRGWERLKAFMHHDQRLSLNHSTREVWLALHMYADATTAKAWPTMNTLSLDVTRARLSALLGRSKPLTLAPTP
jgi:hypothetical protein